MQQLPKRAFLSRSPVIVGLGGFGMVIFLASILLLLVTGGTERVQLNEFLVINVLGFIITGAILLYLYLWIVFFRYDIGEDEVALEKGVIAKSYDSILYSRIQNVNIKRNWIERILGLSTVTIQTAGSASSPEAVIPGIRKPLAKQVRERISDKIHSK